MKSILPFLSSAQGKRSKELNKKLAAEIARNENREAIQELIKNLSHPDKNIQSDCIETLYETGYLKPILLAEHVNAFLTLLKGKNNRMVWGGMIALTTIADIRHKEVFASLDTINETINKGSVITIDCGVIILAKLTCHESYFPVTNPLLMEQLLKCPIKQLPMYAERSLVCINEINKPEFIRLLQNRLPECEKEAQLKRLQKVLKKVE